MSCAGELRDTRWRAYRRIFHAPHEMPTGRSAGMLPALAIRTVEAGNMPALRDRGYEMSRLMTTRPKFRSNQDSSFGLGQRMLRGLWGIVWLVSFRPTPRPFHAWRRFLLRLFGAKIGRGAKVYQSAQIWAPWNLTMADSAVIGPDVDCYCVAPISIGEETTVSQYCYLCAEREGRSGC